MVLRFFCPLYQVHCSPPTDQNSPIEKPKSLLHDRVLFGTLQTNMFKWKSHQNEESIFLRKWIGRCKLDEPVKCLCDSCSFIIFIIVFGFVDVVVDRSKFDELLWCSCTFQAYIYISIYTHQNIICAALCLICSECKHKRNKNKEESNEARWNMLRHVWWARRKPIKRPCTHNA